MSTWVSFKEWFISLSWLQILPIIVAVLVACISYFHARKAIRISKDAIAEVKNANELAEKAIVESKIQFTTMNRPLLIIKPVSFKKDEVYFDIAFLDEKKLIIKIPIEIKNLGNLVADNTFLHSANCMLHINNKFITGDKKEYKTVDGKLTLMDIPPNGTVVKIVDFDFQLPPNLDLKKFRNDLISSCRMDTNFLFHYYSHYEKEKVLASNISYAISYSWYSVLMIKL